MNNKVVQLYGGGDPRSVALLDALITAVSERGAGLPFPTVLGVLKLLELAVLNNQHEKVNG